MVKDTRGPSTQEASNPLQEKEAKEEEKQTLEAATIVVIKATFPATALTPRKRNQVCQPERWHSEKERMM